MVNIIGIISAIIAVISALVSAYFSHRSILSSERARRQQYFSELRQWADEVTGVLSRASHLCKYTSVSELKTGDVVLLMTELSSLIDRGRWFFPNIIPNKYGQDKPEASKGIRQVTLTRLVAI